MIYKQCNIVLFFSFLHFFLSPSPCKKASWASYLSSLWPSSSLGLLLFGLHGVWPPPALVNPSLVGRVARAREGWAGHMRILTAGDQCFWDSSLVYLHKWTAGEEHYTGKDLKAVCWAKPFSRGRNNLLYAGIVPAYLFFSEWSLWIIPQI